MRKYSAKHGSPIDDDQAGIVGKESEIMEREGIPLTPRMLLDRARDETRAIHALFDWHDTSAAEKYRLIWAGKLIRSVNVIEISTKKRPKAFYSINVTDRAGFEDAPNRVYESRKVVLISSDSRMQLSAEFYKKISGICDEVESLGLDKDFPDWKNVICAVRNYADWKMATSPV